MLKAVKFENYGNVIWVKSNPKENKPDSSVILKKRDN